eukprot:UN00877
MQQKAPEGVKVIQTPLQKAVLRDGAPGIFWDRKLKHFNPLRVFNAETRARFTQLRYNYTTHHLFRPKGILSTCLIYGGSGWVASVLFKQRFHKQYEYH